MAQSFTYQNYIPPGPIGAAFIESTFPISIIMGPGGSGKTVASCYKGPYLASSWFPVCRDGVIRVKMTVLRDTYRDLSRTALESWHNEKMFPENHPYTVEYTGGIDRPVVHQMKWATKRGGAMVPVEFTAQFAAIGDANPEQFAKGFETSFAWLNECDLQNERVPGLMFSRTGRYPAVDQIAPSELDRVMRPYIGTLQAAGVKLEDDEIVLPRVLWGDCNPPDFDNWVVKRLVEEPEKWPLYKLFRQPSGLSPTAENRIGKPRSTYEQDLMTMTENDARRYVHGEPGYALDGTPVYVNEFSLQVHRSDEFLKPVAGIPLSLGLDAGGSPAALICQFLPNGQQRVLREVCAEPGTGPTRFGKMLYEVLIADFAGFPIGEAFIDPSAFMGRDTVTGKGAWVDFFLEALNIYLLPTETNEVNVRHDAVKWYLNLRIDGNTPGMIIDPRCKRLIAGFAAHYKFTKRTSAGETGKLQVADHMTTHIHDAEQYVCLGRRGKYRVIKDGAQLGRSSNVVPIRGNVVPTKTFDVFAV